MANWYFSVDGKGYGPFSLDQLHQLSKIEKIQDNDLVWKSGDSNSVRFDQLDTKISAYPDETPSQDQTQPSPISKVVAIALLVVTLCIACLVGLRWHTTDGLASFVQSFVATSEADSVDAKDEE